MKRKHILIKESKTITDNFCFLEGVILISGSETTYLYTPNFEVYLKLEPGKSLPFFYPNPLPFKNGLSFKLEGQGSKAIIYYSEDVDDISDYLLKEKMELIEEKKKEILEKESLIKTLEIENKTLVETCSQLLNILKQPSKPNFIKRLCHRLLGQKKL